MKTPFEKLKATFDELGIHYVVEENDDSYLLYVSSEEEAKTGKLKPRLLNDRHFFEFYPNGEIASF